METRSMECDRCGLSETLALDATMPKGWARLSTFDIRTQPLAAKTQEDLCPVCVATLPKRTNKLPRSNHFPTVEAYSVWKYGEDGVRTT